ncbi:MAG: hypothetical protein VYD19_08695, partial [Myxococcota bacterium]|nr:hypothetical protein [Myxococcota bacterium]
MRAIDLDQGLPDGESSRSPRDSAVPVLDRGGERDRDVERHCARTVRRVSALSLHAAEAEEGGLYTLEACTLLSWSPVIARGARWQLTITVSDDQVDEDLMQPAFRLRSAVALSLDDEALTVEQSPQLTLSEGELRWSRGAGA